MQVLRPVRVWESDTCPASLWFRGTPLHYRISPSRHQQNPRAGADLGVLDTEKMRVNGAGRTSARRSAGPPSTAHTITRAADRARGFSRGKALEGWPPPLDSP